MQLARPVLPQVQLFSFLLLMFCASVTSVQAQNRASTAPADLDVLVRTASTIVRGSVVSAKVEPHPEFPNIQTLVVTLTVTKVLKGEAAPTFTFRQFLWDARDFSILAKYKQSGELLLFLNPTSPYGLTSPVGLEQGRFRILRDASGKQYALNGRGNLGLFNNVVSKASARGVQFSPQIREMLAKPGGGVPLDTFELAIQALVEVSR